MNIIKILKKVLLSFAALLLLTLTAFFVYINIEPKPSYEEITEANLKILNPQKVSITDFEVIAQPDASTCGVTTICMMKLYFSKVQIEPLEMAEKYKLSGGISTDKFIEILSSELPDYGIQYVHDISNLDLIKTVHEQLSQGFPVPLFFGAENPYNIPKYDFHASVIIGLDLQQQKVEIANAYGYIEQISLTDFLDRITYRTTNKYPLVQKSVLKLGLMDNNSIFIIKNK